ncbi:Diphthine synthase [uncultured archaeon]|nr:Diphthine synthase [uncultured archaeon]
MLYLIGLGLNEKSISLEGLEAIKKCKKIYLDNYTVNFPYSEKVLEKIIKKKIISANRDIIESDKLIKEAKRVHSVPSHSSQKRQMKENNVALLVYGSPLTATTHITLIEESKKNKIKCEIIYNASIFDAIAETGLQIYKFGKIASMPKWQKNFTPSSFMEFVKQNLEIGAHSLILIDISLDLKDAIEELEKSAEEYNLKLGKIVICSRMGTKDKKIIYDKPENLKSREIKKPYCMIIPSKLHFMEQEVLEKF